MSEDQLSVRPTLKVNEGILPERINGSRRKTKFKLGEFLCEKTILILSFLSAIMILIVFVFIVNKSWKVFQMNGLDLIFYEGFENQIFHAFRAAKGQAEWTFGIFGLIAGTFSTTLGSLIITVPLGIGAAIVITELVPGRLRRVLQTFIRYLASVPSIIYGLIGLLVVVPFLKSHFISVAMQAKYIKDFQATGYSLLAGIIVLSVMILPIITALTIDALKAVPKKYKESALALGISHWRAIIKVLIPAAKSGIIAGIILATGTAVGEAIALSMVTGGVPKIPNPAFGFDSLFTPVLTLASAIINKSETLTVESTGSALFACGVILLITCTLLSLISKIVDYIVKRRLGID